MSGLDEKGFLVMFEERLAGALATPSLYASREGNTLDEAMRYAALSGGKRVRPMLMFLAAKTVADERGVQPDIEAIMPLAVGLELIHSYSLVHDDLPAMDNDDMRRGKPTVHKAFGEANAILAGDLLLSRAASVLASADIAAAKEIFAAAELMAYGQYYDLRGVKGEEEYLDMYALKTGAMIVAAVRAGAIASGADKDTLDRLGDFAEHIGLAFQLADDLLDKKSDEPSLLAFAGEDRVKQLLDRHTRLALEALSPLRDPSALCAFALRLAAREK